MTTLLRPSPGPSFAYGNANRRGAIAGAIGPNSSTIYDRFVAFYGSKFEWLSVASPLVRDGDANTLDGRVLATARDFQEALKSERLADITGAFALGFLRDDGTVCLARDAIGHRCVYYTH